MSQLTFNATIVNGSRGHISRFARAAKSRLTAAAVIAGIVAMVIALRVVAMAAANREVLEAFRETLRHVAQALGLPG